jgi:hypothetical protein
MAKLEGVTKLRGKVVLLEDLENPVLKRILHMRLRENKFNFYYEDTNYPDYSDYNEYHDGITYADHE